MKDFDKLKRQAQKLPDIEDCELCGGTGIISQDDDDIATYVHFESYACECRNVSEE